MSFAAIHVAHAQPSPNDLEAARAMLRAGDDLRAKKQFKDALVKYKTAHEIVRSPVTGYELAIAYADAGMLASSRDAALAVVSMAASSLETAAGQKARADAAALAEKLDPRIPRVRIVVQGPLAADAKIAIDGRPLDRVSEPTRVDPGTHTIEATNGDARARETVTVAEGETRGVELVLAAPSAPPPKAPEKPLPKTESSTTSPLVYAAFGVGVIGLGIGSVTGLMALSRGSAVKDACNGNDCPSSAKDDYDASRTFGTVSTVAFIAGGVAIAAGVVLLLLPSDDGGRKQAVMRFARGSF